MAESSEDIESGSHRLKSALSGEIGSINRPFKVFLDAFQFGFKLAYRPMKFAKSGSHRLNSALRSKKEASPDKILRNIAFILAVIEKAASTLGTMNFIWATVVLLGGFSQSLKSIDFWFVNAILLVEGLRILCRQGELKTALMTLGSSSPDCMLQLVHLCSLVIQEYSAILCIVLSSLRIHKQQYGSDHNMNRNRALNLFYWLSVVESCLTLFGFAVRVSLPNPPISEGEKDSYGFAKRLYYRFWEKFVLLVLGESLHPVLEKVGFGYAERFFYDTYCRCMKGSAFDGLKRDFVSYSVELLQSTDDNEQLESARVLSVLVREYYPSEKLGAIGTTPRFLETLIELLSWEKPEKKKIRTVAGEIISKLVEIPGNRIRLMAIPASMESIGSLLYDTDHTEYHKTNYQGQSSDEYNYKDYEDFTVMGERILKILANDPSNGARIGRNEGLRRKIIERGNLNPNASESEIIRHLASLPMETLADQQDVRENNNGTSGFEAEHSDDPNLPSVDSQV